MQKKISNFRNWQDAQRCLIGKALLLEGMRRIGLSCSLDDLQFTEYHRPYFDDYFDFNISHSGAFVMCAINETGSIGIDVEEVREISLSDFKTRFSDREWDEISNADNQIHSFFNFWTKKEAFLKAMGAGLHVPLRKVMIEEDKVTWEGRVWFLQAVEVDNTCISHVATDSFLSEMIIEAIDFF